MIHAIDILEAKLLELINDANECIRTGHKVSPSNKFVNEMIRKSEEIIKKTSESLALLGRTREEIMLNVVKRC